MPPTVWLLSFNFCYIATFGRNAAPYTCDLQNRTQLRLTLEVKKSIILPKISFQDEYFIYLAFYEADLGQIDYERRTEASWLHHKHLYILPYVSQHTQGVSKICTS
jgi:hypothetical protein